MRSAVCNTSKLYAATLLIGFFALSCQVEAQEESIFLTDPGPILFVSSANGHSYLYSMEYDGTDVRQVTADSSLRPHWAIWAPDSSKILIGSPVATRDHLYGYQFTVVSRDGQRRRNVFSSEEVRRWNVGDRPVWSPDGLKILYHESRGDTVLASQTSTAISIVDLTSGAKNELLPLVSGKWQTITDWSAQNPPFLGITAESSSLPPFESLRSITMWNSEGDSLSSIKIPGLRVVHPVLSPAEDQIAFGVSRYYRNGALGLIDVPSGDYRLIELTEFRGVTPVSWISDTSKLFLRVYTLGEFGEMRLITFDLETEEYKIIWPF